MKITEQDILAQLVEAEREYQDAKRILAEAKKRWLHAETEVINTSLAKERILENLRVHRNTTPQPDTSLRTQEIKYFQEKYPELCAEAFERDMAARRDKD
jgi:hypothetical protein